MTAPFFLMKFILSVFVTHSNNCFGMMGKHSMTTSWDLGGPTCFLTNGGTLLGGSSITSALGNPPSTDFTGMTSPSSSSMEWAPVIEDWSAAWAPDDLKFGSPNSAMPPAMNPTRVKNSRRDGRSFLFPGWFESLLSIRSLLKVSAHL